MSIETTTELTHYGVPGMKWGKRKATYNVKNEKTKQNEKSTPVKRRVDAKKVAIIGGGIVAAGLVAYGGYYLGKNDGENYQRIISSGKKASDAILGMNKAYNFNPKVLKDSVIPENSVFSTLSTNSTVDRNKTFYATLSGRDKALYRKAFTEELISRDSRVASVYSNGTVNQKPMRVAGLLTASKLYSEFKNDPFSNVANWHSERSMLSALGPDKVKEHDSFLDFMRSKGYDAMVDQMDIGYAGTTKRDTKMGAIKPLIVFGSDKLVDVGAHVVANLIKDPDHGFLSSVEYV